MAAVAGMLVYVGSTSEAKVLATQQGFDRFFKDSSVRGVNSICSGVSAQPVGDEETLKGAKKRANMILKSLDESVRKLTYCFVVGIEGGIDKGSGVNSNEGGCSMNCIPSLCFGWVCIIHTLTGKMSVSRSASFVIPHAVSSLLEEVGYENLELGAACDQVYKKKGQGKGVGGLVGVVTESKISRADFYTDAIVLALGSLMTEYVELKELLLLPHSESGH